MTKQLFIKSYGCQMNVYDSARMADVLAPLGYRPVETPEAADLVILNTCHIREKASEKVFSELGRLRALKESRPREAPMLIAVAGCVAQAEGAELVRRAPQVDMVFGPQTYHRLPEFVARALRGAGAVLDTEFPAAPKFDQLPVPTASGPSAFVTIQEGCDKFCTFCVVPYTRGAEFSRPPAAIEAEVRQLVDLGAVEVTLLGQNVNAYHGTQDGAAVGLADLIARLARIDGLARIRYTTSHPRDMGDDLIAAHGNEPKLMPFLHLPVQSGSDRILAAMNRNHVADDYRRIVERLRAARPDLALSSDFIVGFPGETDAEFEATLQLVRDVNFASAFSFKYSPRPGTPAAVMEAQVEEAVKEERLARLLALLNRQQDEFNHALVGHVLPVLIEGPGRKPGHLAGRSPYLQPVHVPGTFSSADAESRRGAIVDVRIDTALGHSLVGSLADATAAAAPATARLSA